MSSLESIYQKLTPGLDSAARAHLQGAGNAERLGLAGRALRRHWSKEKNARGGGEPVPANSAKWESLHHLPDHETILWTLDPERQAAKRAWMP